MTYPAELFHTANLHFAARAARGRIDAINASPNLQWTVEVACGNADLALNYDHAPTFTQIVQAVRTTGEFGEIYIRSITVTRKRKRALALINPLVMFRTKRGQVAAPATGEVWLN